MIICEGINEHTCSWDQAGNIAVYDLHSTSGPHEGLGEGAPVIKPTSSFKAHGGKS